MKKTFPPRPTATPCANRSTRPRRFALALLIVTTCTGFSLCAQTLVTITNSGFETPTPSVFPNYTVGSTGWTLTNPAINAGNFSPVTAGTTPPPISGVQVGYADGFGGLRQVLGDTFAPNQLYTYSVYLGFRSDEVNSSQGTGAITLGTFAAGVFTPLSTQTFTSNRGEFNFVTGSVQPPANAHGLPIALQLTSVGSYQTLFDQVQLSFVPSAIPEPSSVAFMFGASALGLAWWRRRCRLRRPSVHANA